MLYKYNKKKQQLISLKKFKKGSLSNNSFTNLHVANVNSSPFVNHLDGEQSNLWKQNKFPTNSNTIIKALLRPEKKKWNYQIKLNINSYIKSDLIDSINLIKSFLNALNQFYLKNLFFFPSTSFSSFGTSFGGRGNLTAHYKSLHQCSLKGSFKKGEEGGKHFFFTNFHNIKLFKFSKLAQDLVKNISLISGKIVSAKKKNAVEVFTVIRSPFVYKKTREQFGRTLFEYIIMFETDSKIQQESIIQMINLIKIPAELKIETSQR